MFGKLLQVIGYLLMLALLTYGFYIAGEPRTVWLVEIIFGK